MRVTNSMLVNNFMRNLNTNLTRMDSLQNMLATGRKFAHISDDPTALIYSQAARNKLARLSHYERTVASAQDWLTQVESGVMELQKVMADAYVATIDAATDVKGTDEKETERTSDKIAISRTIEQLRNHFVDTLNTTFGDKYIFGGYNTPGEPADVQYTDMITGPFTVDKDEDGNLILLFNGYDLSYFDGKSREEFAEIEAIELETYPHPGGAPGATIDLSSLTIYDFQDPDFDFNALGLDQAQWDALTEDDELEAKLMMDMLELLRRDVLTFDVGPSISMPVTISGIDLILYDTVDKDGVAVKRNMFNVLNDLYTVTSNGEPAEVINKFIKPLQDGQNHLLTKTAEVGGRTRRLELLAARYEQDYINYERMKSDAEDVDFAEVIMFQKMAEAVYQAALSSGARIIQPTLMDFLR